MRHNKVKIVWSIVSILLLVLVASLVYISISDTMEQKQIVEDGEALGFDFEAHEDKPHESTKEFEKAVDEQDALNNDDSKNADEIEDAQSENVIENKSDAYYDSSQTNAKSESEVSYVNSEINKESGASDSFGPITKEEYDTFKKTCNDTIDTNKMQNIKELMTKDYTGTWYDPENGEAIRLSSEGAYVYIPYLDYYGDTLYQWELIDRSAQGACPMLQIYLWGPDTPGLAYYVAGYNEKYFYGKLQGYIFYKQ
ncbi:hypothetical protein SAMN04487830_10478 [Pseudobutyrivibrio sp. OR37]|uniref:hypothetical protein n=1 Tax=Pseudobutyrivibrio sp. OR37 TaxID=1798186 RepID=UPI0008EF55A3|nr:hypothetical protein [Pseudobutyrivibrio sp. OR37]SFH66040.1 hypothetical protein SAMN04487830_10478 [Pseudobutyrivibrio sp. OR37]